MHYLYGVKSGAALKLAATFDSEQQLLSYVRWATLAKPPDKPAKYEQGSALAGFTDEQRSETPLTDDDSTAVPHNPTPSML